MPFPFAAVALGAGALKGIASGIQGIGAGRRARKINPVWQQYQTSPYAKQMLGDAQSRLNARDFGAQALYNNIQTGAQNAMAGVQRNALTPAAALAAVSAIGAQTNQALFQQAQQEAQGFYARQGRLDQARGVMIGEGDKEYNSMLQKFQMDTAQKNALENKRDQSFVNAFGAIGDAASTVAYMKGMGVFGQGGATKAAGSSMANMMQSVSTTNRATAAGMNPVVGNISWLGKPTPRTNMSLSNPNARFKY